MASVWSAHEVAEEGNIPRPGSPELCDRLYWAIGELRGEWRRRGEEYLSLAEASALVGTRWLPSHSMFPHLPRQTPSDQTIPCGLKFSPKEGTVGRVFFKFGACQVGIEEQVVGISEGEDITIPGETFTDGLLTVSRAARAEAREEVP